MEVDHNNNIDYQPRPKRHRMEPHRIFFGSNPNQKTLELDGMFNVLRAYEDYDGGINCSICGKLYKSRVCFIKHLWEHSVYWDLFDGEKNHDRVLSIQAALILYHGQSQTTTTSSNGYNPLSLLVTSPHEKKQPNNDGKSPMKNEQKLRNRSPSKGSSRRKGSPLKRKRSLSGGSTCSTISDVSSTYSSPMDCSSEGSDSDMPK